MSISGNKSFSATHTGMVRRLNEDSMISRDDIGLWAVADGMGGHQAGDLASQTVTRHLELVQDATDIDELVTRTSKALNQANDELLSLDDQYHDDLVPGSTVAVLLINGSHGAVTWAGDSRIYRHRNGMTEQITHDHSHVQELVDQAVIEPEEAEKHPMSNVITRAIGIDQPLDLETKQFEVLPGDRYLVCSDGLSRLVSQEEIRNLMHTSEIEESVQSLLHTALVRGAPDNVTVVRVDCDPS
ncbi:MAG TPA: protein phosphatase 2C domain-containing protein [Xanthomonadales bacterium]|nr:protein phosphatase 2C domain-containing protein [Xanthomonadales bacterium]